MLAHALRREPFFQALSPEVVARIRNYVYHREYETRQIIYFPDDLFGEDCLVKDGQRGACAVALAPTAVCLMWAEDLRRIVADEAEVALAFALQLGRRVIDLENVLAETVFKTVSSRVAGGLLRLYRRAPHSHDGAIRLTHQKIASLVGSTRETTTTVLHKLREDGILSIANRRVTVLDPVALEHAARSA